MWSVYGVYVDCAWFCLSINKDYIDVMAPATLSLARAVNLIDDL